MRQISGFFNEGLVVTLAASAATLPLVVFYFGRLSAVSLLTNVLILPLQPLIMLGGSAALVAGLIIMVFEFVEVLAIGSPPGAAQVMQIIYFVVGVKMAGLAAVVWFLDLWAPPA